MTVGAVWREFAWTAVESRLSAASCRESLDKESPWPNEPAPAATPSSVVASPKTFKRMFVGAPKGIFKMLEKIKKA